MVRGGHPAERAGPRRRKGWVDNESGFGSGLVAEWMDASNHLPATEPQSLRSLGKTRHTRPSRFALKGRTGEEVNRWAALTCGWVWVCRCIGGCTSGCACKENKEVSCCWANVCVRGAECCASMCVTGGRRSTGRPRQSMRQ